jgi:hypothetical protein
MGALGSHKDQLYLVGVSIFEPENKTGRINIPCGFKNQ